MYNLGSRFVSHDNQTVYSQNHSQETSQWSRGQIDGDTLGPIHAESVYKVKFISQDAPVLMRGWEIK